MLRPLGLTLLTIAFGCKSPHSNSTTSAVVGESGETTAYVYTHSFKSDKFPENIATYEDDYGNIKQLKTSNALCLYQVYVRPGSKLAGNKKLIMAEARPLTQRPIDVVKYFAELDVRYNFVIFADRSLVTAGLMMARDRGDEAEDELDGVYGKRGHRQRDLEHHLDWDTLQETLAIAKKFETTKDITCPAKHPGAR